MQKTLKQKRISYSILMFLIILIFLTPILGITQSVVIKNPYRNGANWYKGQIHIHTNNSTDAVAADNPSIKVQTYKNFGYKFIAVTDHEFVTLDPGITDILYIKYAEEVTKSWGHMGAIGIGTTKIQATSPQASIDEIQSMNGLAIMNHPNFPISSYTDSELVSYQRYNAMEVQDTFVDWGWNLSGDAIARWDYTLSSTNRQIWGVGTDDNHDRILQPINQNCIVLSTPSDELTQTDIIRSLWGGDFYVTRGTNGNTINSITVSGSTITINMPDVPGTYLVNWVGNNGGVLQSDPFVNTQTSYIVNGSEKYVRIEVTRNSNSSKTWSNPLWIISTSSPVNITTVSLPDATLAVNYNQTLSAFGGVAPYTWSIATETSLPDGMTLSATGVLSGTPVLEGQYRFKVKITDSSPIPQTNYQDLWIYVNANLFEDNFGGSLGQWTIVDDGVETAPSKWNITAGQLVQSSNIWDGISDANQIAKLGTYAYAGDTLWHNYEFTLKLRSSDDDGLGVMFRHLDNDNYYRFSLDKQRAYRRLVKKVDGVFSTIIQDNVAYVQNSTYNVKVSVIEDRIIISLNDIVVFDVVDSSLPKGRIGLYCWGNANGFFDDVKVSPVLPLTITSNTLPDGRIGDEYNASLFAFGGQLPYNWSLALGSDPIPNGLSISSAGIISGAPLQSGTFTPTVQVTDSSLTTATKQVSLFIDPALPLFITTNSIPDAIAGFPYTAAFEGTGGAKPYTWNISSGTLTPGLTFANATISGNPQNSDTTELVIQLQDVFLTITTKTFLLNVDPTPPVLLYDNFSSGIGTWTKVDNGNLSVPGGWTVIGGELIQLSNIWDGIDDPTDPVKAGTYIYNGDTSWTDYEIKVNVNSADNDAFGVMFRYQDDDNYYRFSMDAERFYRRLVKKQNGIFTVLAEDIGENSYASNRWFTLLVKVIGDNIKIYLDGELVYDVIDHTFINGKIALYTWANPNTHFDEVLVTTLGKLTITASSPPEGIVGYAYSAFITVAGSPHKPYLWSISSGNLPDGLFLNNNTGEIYGTPSIASTYQVTIQVQDTTGTITNRSYDLVVNPTPPVIITTPNTLPEASQGLPYFRMLEVTGGIPPFTWSLVDGALPAGLSINSTGEISGIPLTAETSFLGFTIRAEDSVNEFDEKSFTLLVKASIPLGITNRDLPNGYVDENYFSTLSSTGGVLPHYWTVHSGSLPPGLSLDSSGIISGIPSIATTGNFIIKLQDSGDPPTIVKKPLWITIQQPLYQNHFDSTTLQDWTIIDEGNVTAPSKWSVDNGELLQNSNIFGGNTNRDDPAKPGTYIFTGDAGWTDYEINFRTSAGDDDSFGVMFRYQDNDNYYRFSMDSQRKYHRIIKKVNGIYSTIADVTATYPRDQWINVKISAAQNKIKVYIDNQKEFDINGNPVTQEGVLGKIVSTGLHNFAMPLFRYQTDDLAVYTNHECSCGRILPLVKRIQGRLQELILTEDNRVLSMTSINMHSDIFDQIQQFQFIQEKKGELVMNIVKKSNYTEKDSEKILQAIYKVTGPSFKIYLNFVNEIPLTKLGKHRFLIQNLPLDTINQALGVDNTTVEKG